MTPSLVLLALGVSLVGVGGCLSVLRGRRVRRALALMGSPVLALDEGADVTLAGTLRAQGPITTLVPKGSEAPVRAVVGATTKLPPNAYLEVGPQKVLLDEAVQIVVGSTERRLASGSVHTLSDGDEVRARGRLVRSARGEEPVEGERGYRRPAETHRLEPTGMTPPVLVAADGPQSKLPPWLVGLAGVPLIGFALWTHAGSSRPAVGCAPDAERLLATNDLVALETFRCNDALVTAKIAFTRGDFVAAHEGFERSRGDDPARVPTVAEIQSAALAHDPDRASALTRMLETAWYPGPSSGERARVVCISDAYASRAQGKRAGVLVDPRRDELWCNYLAADLETEREPRMWALQCDNDDYDTRRLLFLEAGERGSHFTGDDHDHVYIEDYPLPALYDPTGWIAKRHIELEDSLARRLDGGAISYELLAQAALFHAIVGQREQAHTFLTRLAHPGADREPYILGAIAAIYAGDPNMARTLLDLGASDANAVGMIQRNVMPLLEGRRAADESGEPWNSAVLAAIDAHDPVRLAEAFADGRMHRYEALRVRAAFTPAELGPLRRWLREKFPAPSWDHGVQAVGLRLADELALAEAFGDEGLAALLRPRVDAFAAAMTSRLSTPHMGDVSFVDELLERTQDPPPQVWRWHH